MNYKDKISRLEEEISKKTILLMYEPGAGGDFLTSMLSISDSIYGNGAQIEFINDGRIKARQNEKIGLQLFDTPLVFDDYEFYNKDSFFEVMFNLDDLIEQAKSDKRFFISKLHPYLDSKGESVVDKLKNNLEVKYKYSKKILLKRNTTICMRNHILKNAPDVESVPYETEPYSKDWFDLYNKVTSGIDTLIVDFEELVSDPEKLVNKISGYVGMTSPTCNLQFMKETYVKYFSKQRYVENVERYWK